MLALNAYAEMGFQSFNLAVYGAPPGTAAYPLNLRIACRSNLSPFYRSDSTFLERLHWEGAIDLPPETVAERIRERLPRVIHERRAATVAARGQCPRRLRRAGGD